MSNCNGRLYKGTPYDITLPINDGEIEDFLLRFYTDGNNYVDYTIDDVVIDDGVIYVEIEEHTFDLLNEGVLYYDLTYSIDGTEYRVVTNSMFYLKDVDNYSGHTAQDYYDSGYTAGLLDDNADFSSGYTAGMEAQKQNIETINITRNGVYVGENGYSPVYVNVPQSGRTDAEVEEAYTSGYTAGEAAGVDEQKGRLSGITINTNGNYTREDGYSAVTVNIPTTGYTEEQVLAAYNNGYNTGTANQKALLSAITITENGTYTRENGYSAVTVNVESSGTPASPYIAIADITENGVETIDSISHSLDLPTPDINRHTHSFSIYGTWPVGDYQVGEIKRLGEYIEIFIHNGRLDYDDWNWDSSIAGTFSIEKNNGSELTIETNEKAYFDDFTQDDDVKDGTYPISGVRINTKVPQSGTVSTFQDKNYEITVNGYTVITPDSGYDGITGGTINVNVTQTGHTDAELEEAYTSGYTGGEADGMAAQKALMESGTFTSNGTYSRENGYSTVYVNVAQTGHTDAELEEAYTSGYTAGVDEQKELMEELYVSTNGTYTNENGYSTVHVNVTPDGNDFYFLATSSNSTFRIPAGTKYSTDHTTWTEGPATVSLSSGQKAYVRTTAQDGSWPSGARFSTTGGTFDIGGSLETLLCGPNGGTITTSVEGIFLGCKHIVDASKLELAQIYINEAYSNAFYGCTSLEKLPTLPNPHGDGYYWQTFANCTSLRVPPYELPGTIYYSGVNYTYSYENVYQGMFKNCASLEIAPKLPSGTVPDSAYAYMFEGCTSLVKAPELNARHIGMSSYLGMFKGCSSLVLPPSNLPSGILSFGCYQSMFEGCSSLVKTPTRVISSNGGMDYLLKPWCYAYMFANCTSLKKNDFYFSNGTLEGAERCYYGMFSGCTSLEKIEFVTSSYNNATNSCDYMFDGCENLTDMKIITCAWDTNNSTNWVRGVASGGTFTKWRGFNMPFGDDAIPNGWTVNNIE